jgi:cytidine deaminase
VCKVDTQARQLITIRGAGRIRTADGGFADLCLATWLRRLRGARYRIGGPVTRQGRFGLWRGSPKRLKQGCASTFGLTLDLMRNAGVHSMALPSHVVRELEAAARAASTRAYCPYSQFRVGAAVLTDDGSIFAGCNVENASYGLTICAERNAVFQAKAQGKDRIAAVLVYTPTTTATAPCGACRQVIREFGPDAAVICVCDGPAGIHTTLSALLPDSFGPENLR